MKLSREGRIRRDNIRQLNCLICGNPETSWHHVVGHGISGMGMKAPDDMTLPLCHFCHSDLHDNGYKSWEEKHGRTQLEMVDETNKLLELMDLIS